MGYGPYALATGVICGLLADLILKAGNYKSWKHMLMSYCVFSEWVVGSQVIMFMMKNAYIDNYRATHGDAYADAILVLLNNYMMIVVIVAVIVGAIVGAYIGKATLYYLGELTGEISINNKSILEKPIYEIANYVGSVFQNPRTQFFLKGKYIIIGRE